MSDFMGRPLAELLRSKLRRDGLSLAQLAKRLGVGQSYLSQLSCGAKPLSSVSESFLRKCATYLGIPVVYVFLLSGRLQFRDFFSSPVTLAMQIEKALVQISCSDIGLEAGVDTSVLASLPDAAKLLIVLLYERAEQVQLLPSRVGKAEIERIGQLRVPFEIRLNKPD